MPMSENKLTVTSVRYFETRRGLGYEGGTYVSSSLSYFNHGDFHKTFFPDITYGSIDYENALEELINEYEGVGTNT
jgi:hypothetical protein